MLELWHETDAEQVGVVRMQGAVHMTSNGHYHAYRIKSGVLHMLERPEC